MNNLIDQRFGRLLVISKEESKRGRAYWRCKCDCGGFCVTAGHELVCGKKKSCGCLRREICRQRAIVNSTNNILAIGKAAFNLLYATYKNGAEVRNRPFELSKEEFKVITQLNCYYCGKEPKQEIKPYTKGSYKYGSYIYNGVDRKDNNLGYTIFNCVPCCKVCNWMKSWKLTSAEFISACQTIATYQNRGQA